MTDVDSATDTETISSVGDAEGYEYSQFAEMDEAEKEQAVFWAYQKAKGRWRQYMKKPNR